jgi:hypothetical protein
MKSSLAVLVLAFILLTTSASAHPGGTDSSGCHHCWTNCARWGLAYGQYHCHGGGIRPYIRPLGPEDFPSTERAVAEGIAENPEIAEAGGFLLAKVIKGLWTLLTGWHHRSASPPRWEGDLTGYERESWRAECDYRRNTGQPLGDCAE